MAHPKKAFDPTKAVDADKLVVGKVYEIASPTKPNVYVSGRFLGKDEVGGITNVFFQILETYDGGGEGPNGILLYYDIGNAISLPSTERFMKHPVTELEELKEAGANVSANLEAAVAAEKPDAWPTSIAGGMTPVGTGIGRIQGLTVPAPAPAPAPLVRASLYENRRSNPEREASMKFYHAMANLYSGKTNPVGGKRNSLRSLEMVHHSRKNSRRASRKANRKSRKASRKANRKSRKASRRANRRNNAMMGGKRSRKASRKAHRKASRKAHRKSRKASRRSNRRNNMMGGKRSRKNRGLVGTVYKPVGTLAKGTATAVKNVVGTGTNVLNAGVRGLDRTLSGAASTLNRTARNILSPLGLASRKRRNMRKH